MSPSYNTGSTDGERFDFKAWDREILSHLDKRVEVEALGLRIAARAKPNAKGWIKCHAIDGRPDKRPSASFNVETGKFRDRGGDGMELRFFELSAFLMGLSDWRAARDHYAAKLGIPTPAIGSANNQPLRQRPHNPANPEANGGCVDAASRNGGSKPHRRNGSASRKEEKTYTIYPTADAARDVYERLFGPVSQAWEYHNAAGEIVGLVLRWNPPDADKIIRPVSRVVDSPDGDGWTTAAMLAPRPLYRLPELLAAKAAAGAAGKMLRVYVCEGEKAADAVRALGCVAVTSAAGANSPQDTDWRPLAGCDVVILPDNDEPGESYAASVAEFASTQNPPATVRRVHLPDLPHKGDAADWCAGNADAALNELAMRLDALAAETEVWTLPAIPAVPQWTPFPVELLPRVMRRFVQDAAAAMRCDPALIALPALTAAGAMIGNARRIRLSQSWDEPAILWTATVAESGSMKSPAFRIALAPVKAREQRAEREHRDAMRQHETARLNYEVDLNCWRKTDGDRGDPPTMPTPPTCERFYVDNLTNESLGPVLAENPRGVLAAPDELAGLLNRFDRYAPGKLGADVASWLEYFNGDGLTIDRRSGNPPRLFIPRVFVGLTGTVQPDTLRRCMTGDKRENGFAARLLFAWPPKRVKVWSENAVSAAARDGWAETLDRLRLLAPGTDGFGEPLPIPIPLSEAAKQMWVVYYNELNAEAAGLSGDLSRVWSKLECYAPRLALVVHLARAVHGEAEVAAVDAESMAAGIALARWFGGEARRIYAMLDEDASARYRRELAEWIRRKHGDELTVRDAQMGRRELRTAAEAEAALHMLAKAGWGSWIDRPTDPQRGGRPTQVFRLHSAAGTHSTAVSMPTVHTTSAKTAIDGVVLTLTPSAPSPEAGADPNAGLGEIV